jgi:hypothetical protein
LVRPGGLSLTSRIVTTGRATDNTEIGNDAAVATSGTDQIWKHAHDVLERLRADTPEGFVPRVLVTLFDGETFEPGHVAERPTSAWLMFEVDDEGDVITERRRVIAVRPDAIARVEVRFLRIEGEEMKRHPIGFTVGEDLSPELASGTGN